MTTIQPDIRPDRLRVYSQLWKSLEIDPARIHEVDAIIQKIRKGECVYRVVTAFTRVPWLVVAIIHAMESDCDFSTHLFNGDPLPARTVNEPIGQPERGKPPFTWVESAIAAIKYDRIDKNIDWSPPGICWALESYNGFGYVPTPIYSPYLWSFTNHYQQGKFTADGEFDANAISAQAGAMAIYSRMISTGYVNELPYPI